MDNNTENKVDPIVVIRNDNEKKDPEQKNYLLLLAKYDEEFLGEDIIYEWVMILGRSEARQYIIDNISVINPHKSKVLVDGTKNVDLEKIPTVYQLFTDPRSSWNDPNIFPDNFNIDQEMENWNSKKSDYSDNERIPGTSMTSADVMDRVMSADGIELKNEEE